jgi:leucyl-tRNA synthetase
MEAAYPFDLIEAKWQQFWTKERIFNVSEESDKVKFYVLEMFPYPSGHLHMGHLRVYCIGDALAHYYRMKGYNVIHPMGWDAFGLPAENAAFQHKIHPAQWTHSNIDYVRGQLLRMGISYDWEREFATCDEEYYRWTQWLFLKFYERGLVYKKRDSVNWCESCSTVLANEQVEDGRCWRCDTQVVQKEIDVWFFKITDYAQRLLEGHKQLEGHWPERILTMQKNWIGKSSGVEINFTLEDTGEILPVFTTRPDTIFGATYLVLAVKHPLVEKIIEKKPQRLRVEAFIESIKHQDKTIKTVVELEKEGVFTGGYAINPVNGDRLPIWVANYVLMEYGTGAIMAVPAHDQRDFEFSRKYHLPLRLVIHPGDEPIDQDTMTMAYEGEGVMVNSGNFNNLPNKEGMEKIADWIEETGIGGRAVKYRLRDWSVSRQRFWGEPVPIIYCEECGVVAVPEKDLPVRLPKDLKFE